MGTEMYDLFMHYHTEAFKVKLNNPLMGTEICLANTGGYNPHGYTLN